MSVCLSLINSTPSEPHSDTCFWVPLRYYKWTEFVSSSYQQSELEMNLHTRRRLHLRSAPPPPLFLNKPFPVKTSCILFSTTIQVRINSQTFFTIKVCPTIRHGRAWEGETWYSSYSILTSALDEGERSASRPSRALPPDKDPLYPFYRRLGGPQNRSGHSL
jgi:hypothetical protein